MQLGPISVTPASRAVLMSAASAAIPASPASEKPAATTSAAGIPRSPHCSITPGTWAAPTATSARSGALGQLRNAAEGGQAEHRAPATVHGVDGASETSVDQGCA